MQGANYWQLQAHVLIIVALTSVVTGAAAPAPTPAPIVVTNVPATSLPSSLTVTTAVVKALSQTYTTPHIVNVNDIVAAFPAANTVNIGLESCRVNSTSLVIAGYNSTIFGPYPKLIITITNLVLTQSTLVVKGYFPPKSIITITNVTATIATALNVGQTAAGISMMSIGFQQLMLDNASLVLSNAQVTLNGGSLAASAIAFYFGFSAINYANFTMCGSTLSVSGSNANAIFCDPNFLPRLSNNSVVMFSRNRMSATQAIVVFDTNGPSIRVNHWSVFSFEYNVLTGGSGTCISMAQVSGSVQTPSVSGISDFSALAFVNNSLACGSGIPIDFNGVTPVINVNSSYIMIYRNTFGGSAGHAIDSTGGASGQCTGGSVMTMSFNVYTGSPSQLLGGSMWATPAFSGSINNYTLIVGCEKKTATSTVITYCCTVANASSLMGPSSSSVNAAAPCSTCNVAAVCFRPNAISASMNADGSCNCSCRSGSHPQCLMSWGGAYTPPRASTQSVSTSSTAEKVTLSSSFSVFAQTSSASSSSEISVSASSEATETKTISPLVTHFPRTVSPVASNTHSHSPRITRFPKTKSQFISPSLITVSVSRRSPSLSKSGGSWTSAPSSSASPTPSGDTISINATSTENRTLSKWRGSRTVDLSRTHLMASKSKSESVTDKSTTRSIVLAPTCRVVVSVTADNSTPIVPFVNGTLIGPQGEAEYAFICSSMAARGLASSNSSRVSYPYALTVATSKPYLSLDHSSTNVTVTNASNGLGVSWDVREGGQIVFNMSFPSTIGPGGYFAEIRVIPDATPFCLQQNARQASALVFVSCPAAAVTATTLPIAQTSATATKVVSVAALVSGSPTTASSQARTSMLLQLVNCTFQLTSGGNSITGLTFGSDRGQVVRGAVVGNLLLLACGELIFEVASVIVALAAFSQRQKTPSSVVTFRYFLQRVRYAFHVPSVINVFACLTLQPTISAALILIFTVGDGADIALGIFGLLSTGLYVVYIVYHLVKHFHGALEEGVCREYFASELVREERRIVADQQGAGEGATKHRDRRQSAMVKMLLQATQPQGTWSDSRLATRSTTHNFDDDPLLDKSAGKEGQPPPPTPPRPTEWLLTYVVFFKDFRQGWYHVADTLLNVAFGVVQGIIVERKAFCISQLVAATILFVVQLWILVRYKPMLSFINAKYMLVSTLIGLVCSIMILVGLLIDDSSWIDSSNYLTLVNSLLSGAKTLMDLCLLVLEIQLVMSDVRQMMTLGWDMDQQPPVLPSPPQQPLTFADSSEAMDEMQQVEQAQPVNNDSTAMDDFFSDFITPPAQEEPSPPVPVGDLDDPLIFGTALVSAEDSVLLGIRLNRDKSSHGTAAQNTAPDTAFRLPSSHIGRNAQENYTADELLSIL